MPPLAAHDTVSKVEGLQAFPIVARLAGRTTLQIDPATHRNSPDLPHGAVVTKLSCPAFRFLNPFPKAVAVVGESTLGMKRPPPLLQTSTRLRGAYTGASFLSIAPAFEVLQSIANSLQLLVKFVLPR